MDTSYFNGSPRPASKKPKRPNKWYRVATHDEYEFVRNSLRYGILLNAIAQIFTLDEKTIEAIGLSGTHTDYLKRITKVIEEGRDETRKPISTKKLPKYPHTDRRGWGV